MTGSEPANDDRENSPGADNAATVALTRRLKEHAQRLGFALTGVAPAVTPPGYPRFLEWLERGFGAGMPYLERHAEARNHPESILTGVRSVVMVAMNYGPGENKSDPPLAAAEGKIARYARGEDYHRVLWDRLGQLLAWFLTEVPDAQGRAIADTAPLLERDYAQLAGLGWIGKNTLLIHKAIGSYTVLGALLLDRELIYDAPHASSHCGTCTRCLDACPTQAFPAPGVMDATRCLSYWSIEHKGVVPAPWSELTGDWVFGCDICQEVCPWNRKAPGGDGPLQPLPEWTHPNLIAWLDTDETAMRRALKPTALSRAKRSGLVRNAVNVLTNRVLASETEHPVKTDLQKRLAVLADDPDPAVRETARIACTRLAGESPKK